jgi:hypothetical protein
MRRNTGIKAPMPTSALRSILLRGKYKMVHNSELNAMGNIKKTIVKKKSDFRKVSSWKIMKAEARNIQGGRRTTRYFIQRQAGVGYHRGAASKNTLTPTKRA